MVDTPAAIPWTRTKLAGLVLGPVAFVLLHFVWGGPEGQPAIGAAAGVAALMAIWWTTEALPLTVTALVPLPLLPLLGITDAKRVAGFYFSEIIVLNLGAFLIALAMERWDLHRRIALRLIQAVGVTPGAVVAGFLLGAAVLSMWISNTATALMMLPIGLAVIRQLEATFGIERSKPLSLGLMLAIAYGASIGGIATPVGTPTNLAFLKIYRDTFPSAPALGFGEWMLYAVPLSAFLLAATWILIVKVYCRTDSAIRLDRAVVRRELEALGPIKAEERTVAWLFTTAAVLWLFRQDLNVGFMVIPGWTRLSPVLSFVDDSTVAIGLALLLFVLPARSGGALLDASVFNRVSWDVLLLLGGGFALAGMFVSSGLSGFIAQSIGGLDHVPEIVLLLLICLIITFLTELTSNVATVTMFLPVLAALAVGEGINPLMLMVPATISASMAFMLPVATPPNAIIFSSRRVRIGEMARIGIALNLLGVLVIAMFSKWVLPSIMRFDPTLLPTWAAP